jgi:hypothetical protein
MNDPRELTTLTGLDGLNEPAWRKSSFSGPQGGECVEVAKAGANVLVRDSKHPEGTRLALSPSAWSAFLTGIRKGEFDLA